MNISGRSAATPALQDIDDNGKLDLILHYANHIVRFELEHPRNPNLRWTQFRGKELDGFYRP